MKLNFKVIGTTKLKMIFDDSAHKLKFVCDESYHVIKMIAKNAIKFITCSEDIFCNENIICGTEEYLVPEEGDN